MQDPKEDRAAGIARRISAATDSARSTLREAENTPFDQLDYAQFWLRYSRMQCALRELLVACQAVNWALTAQALESKDLPTGECAERAHDHDEVMD